MDTVNIATNIANHLDANEMSVADLGRALECSWVFASKLVSGEKTPSVAMLIKISGALELSLDDLVGVPA